MADMQTKKHVIYQTINLPKILENTRNQTGKPPS